MHESDDPNSRSLIPPMAKQFFGFVKGMDTVTGSLYLVLVLIFAGVFLFYFLPREQSYIVFAETRSLSVMTDRNPELYWELSQATLCKAIEKPDTQASFFEVIKPDSDSKPEDQCNPAIYDVKTLNDVAFEWPEGIGVNLRLQQSGQLELLLSIAKDAEPLVIDGNDITDKSLLRFPATLLKDNGILVLTGKVQLGENAVMGARSLLEKGRYEIRENVSWSARYQLVQEGLLTIGDKVSVMRSDDESLMNGRVFIATTQGKPDLLSTVLTTQPARSVLSIKRADIDGKIKPNWISRLASDAWPAVLTTLLGLFGASLGIVQSFRNIGNRP